MKIAIIVAALLLATFTVVGAEATSPKTTTTTNKCVVYSLNGVYSGGIQVVSPDTVTYRQIDSGSYWLQFSSSSGGKFKVDTLGVSPLPPPPDVCVGIV